MNPGKAGIRAGATAAAVLFSATLVAQTPVALPSLSGVSHYTLRNGLTVILHEKQDLPVVSVAVGYNAGSIHEVEGKSGIAYLLENLMMFAGSANVDSFRHISDIDRVGGTWNAETLEDQTLYFQTVPSNHLALALWLESDRMRTLDLSVEKFERARSNLLEDLQRRKASEPYLNSLQAFDGYIYSDFPYGHSLLGTEEDIRNLTRADIKAFYDARYVPQNAVLCVSGKFERNTARELIARYFETLPGGKAPASNLEPRLFSREKFSRSMADPAASAPAVFLGFRLAPPESPDFPILTLLDFVLMRGRSARLPRRLLNREAKIAYQLSGGIDRRFNQAVYKILMTASPSQIQACQEAVFSELEKIKGAFLKEAELAKAKTLYRQDLFRRTATAQDWAIFLIQSFWTLQTARRTLDDLPDEWDKVLRVTASDLVGIAARYFTVDNCVVLNVQMR